MSQRDDFVAFALAEVGVLQYGFADRCGWSDGETDCSGLVSGSAQRAGLSIAGCPNSSALARWCHTAPRPQWMLDKYGPDPWTGSATVGTGLSAAQAVTIKGAIKFHGADEGQDGDGPHGHVAIGLGDGRSVEALSHALDLRIWQFIESKNTYYSLLPGMTGFDQSPGSNPNPSSSWEAEVMGMIAAQVPGAHVQTGGPHRGTMPFIAAQSGDGIVWAIAGYNGAVIVPPQINAQGKPTTPVMMGGVSVLQLGKLNKPIVAVSVVFISDPDDHTHTPPHVIPSRQVVFIASDGGTFGPYRPEVHYG